MNKAQKKQEGRMRRHARIRARVSGTASRPRLAVFRSNRYVLAQIIDDTLGTTLLSGSTKDVTAKGVTKTDAAVRLGADLAKRAKAAGISAVVFDRGGSRFAGRIAALATAAREGGLEF